jgi:RsiW-degrading membrane proteinase PrsW (M82 family)
VSFADRLLALLGVVPPFLLLWWAESFERRVLEPLPDWRYRVLAAGGFISIPVLIVERALSKVLPYAEEPLHTLFDAFVIAGAVEEVGKALCVVLLARGALGPRTRYGAFLYALHAAMGFALVENVLAMLKVSNMVAFSTRFFLRAYLTVPMHLVAGGALGYLWARRRFEGGPIGLAGGLGVAILIHGGFNAMLLAVERLPDHHGALAVLCALGAMALPLVGLVVLRVLAGRLREDDSADARSQRGDNDRRAAPQPSRA